MGFYINSDNGSFHIGPLNVSWGNALQDLDLSGFATVGLGELFLELGDIDQGKPGIYLTRFVEGDPRPLATIWQAS
jgi:hypothetical protein